MKRQKYSFSVLIFYEKHLRLLGTKGFILCLRGTSAGGLGGSKGALNLKETDVDLILTAVLFLSYTFHNIAGIDEPCQLKQNRDTLDIRQRQGPDRTAGPSRDVWFMPRFRVGKSLFGVDLDCSVDP